MIQVEYIGPKPTKTDNVAGTATVWNGAGDVQSVTPEAWAKLKPFDTVWREADQAEGLPVDTRGGTLSDASAQSAPKYVIAWHQDGAEKTLTLGDMDAESIHAFLKEKDLRVDARIKNIDTLRAAAFKVATEG
jgi:hypothetical protein